MELGWRHHIRLEIFSYSQNSSSEHEGRRNEDDEKEPAKDLMRQWPILRVNVILFYQYQMQGDWGELLHHGMFACQQSRCRYYIPKMHYERRCIGLRLPFDVHRSRAASFQGLLCKPLGNCV